MSIDLHAVCIGRVEEVAPGTYSAIRKQPVRDDAVEVGELGIAGDEQQEKRLYHGRQLHGGPDKAVCAYPHEHLPVWAELLEREVPVGTFGENLSIGGLLEDEVHVGDEWQWGDVRLRVTEPRLPCFKLDLVLGRKVKRVMLHGAMTGWYLAVVEPGPAPTVGRITVVARGDGPTITDVLRGRKS
ncbi:MAG: domain containing protein [Actinomycetia bacterium]|nr:domain containing protein [Actinomycetes bacterium]